MWRWLAPGLLLSSTVLHAQGRGILLLERRFGADSSASQFATVTLQRRIVYRAELIGPGLPVFEPVNRGDRPAFIVPVDTLNPTVRRFEVYALEAGPHRVSVAEIPAGMTTHLKLYQDSTETRRIAEKQEQGLVMGVLLAAGSHEGYRLETATPPDPNAALTTTGCVLLETNRFGTCLGAAGDKLPESGYSVLWLFIEERVRIVTAKILDARHTDVGGSLRISQAFDAGPHGLDPSQVSWGFFLSQALGTGSRRGVRLILGWQRNHLRNTSQAEPSYYDRITAGIVWMP